MRGSEIVILPAAYLATKSGKISQKSLDQLKTHFMSLASDCQSATSSLINNALFWP
jgi:hypothetical protein